jgi:protein required for attachment to host cells
MEAGFSSAMAKKALFLINEGNERYLNLRRLSVLENPDPPSREQGSDAPGRVFSSVGEINSAVEETDWHELQKERFAASIAGRINKAALSAEFNQIVVVAPPKILGELRHAFSKETEGKIVAELGKDLTNHTIEEIERSLMAQ